MFKMSGEAAFFNDYGQNQKVTGRIIITSSNLSPVGVDYIKRGLIAFETAVPDFKKEALLKNEKNDCFAWLC
ncbi:hypothetical protein [Paenibacillus periandrae]|uniref:hypothetical protein n=1 Tax=Paenibacillus periandrae TaxID=1761741 RepID=UPI001F08FEE1|nr:hypothetical protein [Paenibacillus periandrae]